MEGKPENVKHQRHEGLLQQLVVEDPAGTPAAPEQGFEGKDVQHKDMETAIGDWRREYGPKGPYHHPAAKLKSNARPFKSARTPAKEVMEVIASAVEVLSNASDISGVRVHDGGMGGTTMIVGKSSSSNPDALLTFSVVKDTLLRSAEKSENTYILGYGAQPFNNLDPLSFSANIAHMPKAHYDTACWDTYENGSCPRCATCRWDHPSDIDQIRVIVMIQKAGPSLVVDQRMQ